MDSTAQPPTPTLRPRRRQLIQALGLVPITWMAGCGGSESSKDDPVNPSANAPVVVNAPAWDVAKAMGPGINFGNMLDAPNEGDWGVRLKPEYIPAAWSRGFRTIRLPVRWSNHTSAVYPYAVDPTFMARVTTAVDAMLAQGFHVVLDMHHHRQLDGDALDAGEFQVPDEVLVPRFIAMWDQIATHFAGRSSRLLFELYNEPHGPRPATEWNELFRLTLRQVRISNPNRLVMLSPINRGSSYALESLVMPVDDPYLMATIHTYDPYEFTHQGLPWLSPPLPTGLTCCSAAQVEAMANPIRHASLWSAANQRPVFLGEFGANNLVDTASRVAYVRQVRQLAQAANMPWAYWEFASDFGVYDPDQNQFRAEVTDALLKA